MLENLLEFYRKSDGATKKKILSCIFAEKLVFEKGKVATPVFTEPVQLILRINEVLGSSKRNKRSILTSCASGYPERDFNLFYCI
jgi:site-specific DNA recombinase